MSHLFGMTNFMKEIGDQIIKETLKEADVIKRKIFFEYRSSKAAE